MAKPELENLVEKTKQLKREAPLRKEYDGMIKSAQRGLADAQNEDLETDSQFDLAVEAAHKIALAALRREGYRSENRITVCQSALNFDPVLEWAPGAGQDQSADLTIGRVYCSSNCTGLM